jgi:ATP-dependent helicase HrpB
MQPLFPVLEKQKEIAEVLARQGRLLLCAPPGTGKSTQVPFFFLDTVQKPVLVLQPRRIAARNLAVYTAAQRNEAPGATVGYVVRHENKTCLNTRVIYATYGVFLRRALSDPFLEQAGLVILDEFHERTLDMDLALAWMKYISGRKHAAPPFLVMSATLDEKPLLDYLGLSDAVTVKAAAHPVDLHDQPPLAHESMEAGACRAVKTLLSEGAGGSVLVFMPGVREIDATIRALAPAAGRARVPLLGLHGRLPLAEQARVIRAPLERGRAVIVSTNVAETSLTVPGVRAVVDSGYERRAAFDPARKRNTLYISRICRASAVQRAGRAGREAPGTCVRLYGGETLKGMAESIVPEIARLELSQAALTLLGLLDRAGHGDITAVEWLTRPDPLRWNEALADLVDLGAAAADFEKPGPAAIILPPGKKLLKWPVEPRAASAIAAARSREVLEHVCAMLALWENHKFEDSADLFGLAGHFLSSPRSHEWNPAVFPAYQQLIRAADKSAGSGQKAKDVRKETAMAFLKAFFSRTAVLAVQGARYDFDDNIYAVLDKKRGALPRALVAFEVLETAGQKERKQSRIKAYMAVEPEWIVEARPGRLKTETVYIWDERKKAVVAEEHGKFGDLVLSRKPAQPNKIDKEKIARLLAEKCLSGEVAVMDDKVRSLLSRIRLIAQGFPEYGLRMPDDDDLRLIYEEACAGARAAKDLTSEKLAKSILAYFGVEISGLLDAMTPERIKLKSGKTARVFYPENGPPELSARITDFWGFRGRFTVCQGKVAGIFDILAPNWRTVQKTDDLDRFWKTAYPEIKPGLKRRYPRHPWP